jgi:hypothetical protein
MDPVPSCPHPRSATIMHHTHACGAASRSGARAALSCACEQGGGVARDRQALTAPARASPSLPAAAVRGVGAGAPARGPFTGVNATQVNWLTLPRVSGWSRGDSRGESDAALRNVPAGSSQVWRLACRGGQCCKSRVLVAPTTCCCHDWFSGSCRNCSNGAAPRCICNRGCWERGMSPCASQGPLKSAFTTQRIEFWPRSA